ncbi:response regulator transcription factor [Paraburkholderia ferrariae]|uniref:response regulator transcription factor n=1 Tax=Paraburkholderia ferrariae TaxID=386056 RepID=UPI00048663A1|nr:response regulator transcription factor [Paraburkholderia ferrariae]
MTNKVIRVALADDHPAVLAGIKAVLSKVESMQVVGTASNSTELMELLGQNKCDVLVADYAMPGGKYGDGFALLSLLRRRFPDLKIIVFTGVANGPVTQELSKIGIYAVLNKSDDMIHLVAAIHAVFSGASYTAPSARNLQQLTNKGQAATQTLSIRETEVIRLYLSGLTVREISEQLHRAKQTVSAQKVSAMRKLGAKRETDLFRLAAEVGIVASPETTFSADDSDTEGVTP